MTEMGQEHCDDCIGYLALQLQGSIVSPCCQEHWLVMPLVNGMYQHQQNKTKIPVWKILAQLQNHV